MFDSEFGWLLHFLCMKANNLDNSFLRYKIRMGQAAEILGNSSDTLNAR